MIDITDKKIAILVHNYFEQSEFEVPFNELKDAGASVTVVSAAGRNLQALNHVDKADKFMADLLLDDANSEDYDALILPGGAFNADTIRMNKEAQNWAIHFLDNNKPIAAICHSPWLLVSADLIEGRRLTSYYTIQDDIRNAGGEWIDLPLVVDDNLITSRKPEDLPDFVEEIISQLNKLPSKLLAG